MEKKFKILLADDDSLGRDVLIYTLEGLLGFEVKQCENGKEALEAFQQDEYQLIITDIKMPEMNGIELLKSIRALPNGKDVRVVLFTGFAEIDTAIEALRYGAFDYLLKPVDINKLHELIEKTQRDIEEKEKAESETSQELDHDQKLPEFTLKKGSYLKIADQYEIGVFSKGMRDIVTMAMKFHKERDIPVLIEGESGTGKEVIADIIHHGEEKSERPFIPINCSAISPSLFESELFGYAEGAFTGSKAKGSVGKLEMAQGGTIFLDEVGEMPLDMQPKLLRVLQEKEMFRVGGDKEIKLDVRIIAATNQPLKKLVADGKFRQDLYQRLNPGTIYPIPLREQKAAIAPLAQMFLVEFAQKRSKKFRLIHKDAISILEKYHWPGNIRELRNTVDRIVLLYDEIELRTEHLSFIEFEAKELVDSSLMILRPGAFQLPDDELNLRDIELEIVKLALEKFDGNKSQTARYLGLTPTALRSRLKEL